MKKLFNIILIIGVATLPNVHADTNIDDTQPIEIENKPEQQSEIKEESESQTQQAVQTEQSEQQEQSAQPAANVAPTTSSQEKSTIIILKENISKEEEIIKEMLSKNPFSDSPNSSNGTTENSTEQQSPEGLELRGISRVDGNWTFFIHDTQAKLDYKIGMKQPITEKIPFTIDFYDDETNSVSISNNISSYILTLKTPDAPSGKAPSAAPLSSATAKKPQSSVKTKRK